MNLFKTLAIRRQIQEFKKEKMHNFMMEDFILSID